MVVVLILFDSTTLSMEKTKEISKPSAPKSLLAISEIKKLLN